MAKQQTIWVVDDDSELRQLLSTYLGEQGLRCAPSTTASSSPPRLEFQRLIWWCSI